METRFSPLPIGYGTKKVATGASGHAKAHHLVPLFGAVQAGSEVLFLAAYPWNPPSVHKPEAEMVCLQSHLDLPAEAAVWTQDAPVNLHQPSQTLSGNVCFLRLGDVAVGIRFVLATDITGQQVTAQLINDGSDEIARRLSLVHSAGPPGDGQGTVAVFIRAQEGLDDAGFADFRQKFFAGQTSGRVANGVATASAAGLKGALTLQFDLAKGTQRQSTGADPALLVPPMSVNGKEYSSHILQHDGSAGFE